MRVGARAPMSAPAAMQWAHATVTSGRRAHPEPEPRESHHYREVAESFASDAARYDRSQPSYPQSLVNRIIAASPAGTSSTPAAGPASPPGNSRPQAPGCSGWIPTSGWPTWPGAAGSTSKWPRSRPGIRPAVTSTRSSRARPGTGWTRWPGRPRRRGAAPGRPAGRLLELLPAPARAERSHGGGLPPGHAGPAGLAPGPGPARTGIRRCAPRRQTGCGRRSAFGDPEQ